MAAAAPGRHTVRVAYQLYHPRPDATRLDRLGAHLALRLSGGLPLTPWSVPDGPPVAHVEIVFEDTCAGPEACPWPRRTRSPPAPGCCALGRRHQVWVSAWAAATYSCGVRLDVDAREHGYQFVDLPMSAQDATRVVGFAHEHLAWATSLTNLDYERRTGLTVYPLDEIHPEVLADRQAAGDRDVTCGPLGTFNRMGVRLNFMCLTSRLCYAGPADARDLTPRKPMFCSELVASSLMQCPDLERALTGHPPGRISPPQLVGCLLRRAEPV